MSVFFTPAEIALMGAMHVSTMWFARLDLPDGEVRMHEGTSTLMINGEEWHGVADPIGGRLVGISQIQEPVVGQAAAVTLTLSGASDAFVRDFIVQSRHLKGRRADLYWAMFDGETQALIGGLVPLWDEGRMFAPSRRREGLGTRVLSVMIESWYSAQNFTAGRMWNSADQHRLYPGEQGMDFIGVDVTEIVQ